MIVTFVPAAAFVMVAPVLFVALPSVTVISYSVTGLSSQMAYNVVSAVTLIVASSITAPVALVAQPLNCLPVGAVNAHEGKEYAPETPVTSAIAPEPPFLSNFTV